jgi:tetratricopeptide (TPR) repeat protein
LSIVGEICEEAINAGSLPGASGIPFVEACRLYLTHGTIPEHERPSFYCRLSEALLHRGRRDDAVDCARIAFDLQPATEGIANICAWVFSNCDRHEEAAAYERLLDTRPRWAEGHRHASGSLAVAGRVDGAIFHGRRASDLDPNSYEFAVHAACLLEGAGRYGDAITYFTRAAAIEPGDTSVLRHVSAAHFALGQSEDAVELALRAVALAPGDRLNALHATELLLRTRRGGHHPRCC